MPQLKHLHGKRPIQVKTVFSIKLVRLVRVIDGAPQLQLFCNIMRESTSFGVLQEQSQTLTKADTSRKAHERSHLHLALMG
jgi:hypothetical protein